MQILVIDGHPDASSHCEALAPADAESARAGGRFPWLKLKLSANGPAEDLFGKLDDTRFTLILIGQAVPSGGLPGLDGLLRSVRVPADPPNDRELARARIPWAAFYLLRRDGHVGLAGTRLEPAAVTRYLVERLNLRVNTA